jgi:hypothetical protein
LAKEDALMLQKFMKKSMTLLTGDIEIFKKLDALGREVEEEFKNLD